MPHAFHSEFFTSSHSQLAKSAGAMGSAAALVQGAQVTRIPPSVHCKRSCGCGPSGASRRGSSLGSTSRLRLLLGYLLSVQARHPDRSAAPFGGHRLCSRASSQVTQIIAVLLGVIACAAVPSDPDLPERATEPAGWPSRS